VKIPSIDSNNNPTIQKTLIVLLKLPNVLILAFGHFIREYFSSIIHARILPRSSRHLDSLVATPKQQGLATEELTWRMTSKQLKKIRDQKRTIFMDLPFTLLKHAGKILNI